MKKQIRPVGDMVLIRHDEETKSGSIILPDSAKNKTMTGMIIAVPEKMRDDSLEYPFSELDRVIYDVRDSIPVSLDLKNRDFLVNYKSIYAIVNDQEVNDQEE